jgi:hypothetical protein
MLFDPRIDLRFLKGLPGHGSTSAAVQDRQQLKAADLSHGVAQMTLWLRSSFRTRAIRFARRRYLHRLGIVLGLLAIQCCERSAQQQGCDPRHSEKRDKHRYGMFVHCALPHLLEDPDPG